MTVLQWIKQKILGVVGLSKEGNPNEQDRLTFINDPIRIMLTKLQEYNVWYAGDSDEIMNFYTHTNLLEYNYEPWFDRNKREYFWSVSATENGMKRTHSGQPRNIVDTIVAITKYPTIRAGGMTQDTEVDSNLQKILKDSDLKSVYKNQQMPMTLVEGWGCYKINWDMDISDYPFAVYYRAANVDFIYSAGRIIGIIFKDYYTNDKKRYLLTETRRTRYDAESKQRFLVIEKELFEANKDNEFVNKVPFESVPELKETHPYIEIGPFDDLLAVPCIFFENNDGTAGYGRSIYTGKVDLFDDLDQCLSQAANAVRRSTPIEYFNTDYLERDSKTGLPKQPKAFDRKYTMYAGQKNADGVSGDGNPVQVTQPSITFEQYSQQATQIMLQIINGVMSPATLGIDIAKKDNAEAQREKEKVTIFTRNSIIDVETTILKSLCSQLLCAYEFITKNEITCKEYEISVKFSEFADDSYENKLSVLSQAFDTQALSEEMYMNKLYGDTLTKDEFDRELKWLKENHTEPKVDGMKGAAGGGMNLPGMFDGGDEEEEL